MDDRTRGHLRDGLLALTALGGLLWHLRERGDLGALVSPRAATVGVVGALGVEAAMLRHPDVTRRLWERPAVQVGSLVGTVVGGRALARRAGPWAAASLCWGLVTYLCLLGTLAVRRP